MLVPFLPGWQSVPGDVKPTDLAEHGHEVINPKLPGNDLDAAHAIPKRTTHAAITTPIQT
jgi:hypothetical protein